ncbi:MAG: hypothetical protein HYZ84_02345, partial [Candidatus Omnitrophica bacterium]|nr:hypothetical protein [Candidatus Omnitrophota bacterium]
MAEAGRPASSPASKISPENLSSIKIPEEIGKIQEVYQGKSQDLIILVQDAHAVPDAQRNIQNIISHFQKEYGLDRVALEGASRELDPQIFRSFPDKKLLKQTFEDYFKNGELAGTVAAAIFSSQENGSRIVFQGVEDWSLYEDGIALYLSALQEENSALEKIYSFKEEIEKQKELIYSKQLLELDRTLADFESNHARLFDVLKKLARIQLPEKGTELALLIGEIKKDGKSDFSIESEIKKLVKDARASLGSTQADMGEFNHKFQDFRTSRITPEAFALYLKERVDSLLLSNRLNHLIQNQKRLKEIEGTKFFQDFEQYTQSVKNSLFQNEEERKLDQVSREILILKRLARLELSHQDWNEIKNHSWILDRGLENDLKFHLDFYQNAQKRDKALFHHLMESTHTSLLVAGGFHTQGLTEQLKEKGISYLLLTPAIKDIPEANHYRQHMSGDVSWKNYFKVENGKVDLHGAFVRALRDRLLSSPRQEGFDAVLAKQWRDQIIRDLAASGRIEKAGDYTPFLDEIFSSAASTDLRTLWQARVENFLENLNLLQSQNQLTESNVLKLLNPATSVGLTTGPGGALQRGTAVRPRLIPGAFPARFNPRAQNKKVKPKTAVDKKSRPVEKITKMHVTRPKGRLTGRLPRLGARSELRSVDWRIVAAGVLGVGIIGFIGFIRLATEESRLRRQYTEWIHKNTFTTLSYNLNSQNLDKIVRGLSKTFYNRDSRNTGVISWISVIPIWPFHNLNRVFASRQLNFGWPWLFGSYRDHSQIAPVARTTLLSFVKAIENNPSFERIKLLDRDFSGDAIAVDYVRETLKELASGTNSIISRAAQEVLEGKHFAPKSKSEMRISPAELTHEVSPQGITPLGYYGLMVMAGLSAYWFFKTANGLKDIFIGVLAFIVSGIAAHLGSLKADRVRADRPFAKVRNELETILKQAKQENYSAAAAINNKIAHYPLIDRLNIWIFAAHELSQVSDWLLAGDDFKVDYKADRGAFSVTLHRVSASSKSELRLPARQREKKLRQETARFTEYHRLTSDQLKQLRASIQKFMEKVPGEETMLRNYQGLPDFEKWVGKEFLKVNIGGTNLEIARQRLKENGKLETLAIKKYRFSVADKSGT